MCTEFVGHSTRKKLVLSTVEALIFLMAVTRIIALINTSLYCWSCRWATSRGWQEWWPTNAWLCHRTVTVVMEQQQNYF